jgi:hypothetical protein
MLAGTRKHGAGWNMKYAAIKICGRLRSRYGKTWAFMQKENQ